MAMYNPVTDSFTYYTPVEPKEVKLDLPLLDEPISLPWASRIANNGSVIVSDNTSQQQDFEDIFSYTPEQENTEIIDNQNNSKSMIENIDDKTINQNLKGYKKQAMEFFKNKGLSSIHSAGIVGNLLMESSLNPNAVNPSSKAFGIAQWLGDRKKNLFKKYGNNPTFEQQLEFLWDELNGSEKFSYVQLLNTKSYQDAVKSIMDNFERPSKKEKDMSISKRIKFAKELLS